MTRPPLLIQDVLAVLAEMRDLARGRLQGHPVADLRSEATEAVAVHTNRSRTTIHDALARRLNMTAPDFDAVASEWLQGRPARLKDVLERHAADDSDRLLLREFFVDVAAPSMAVHSNATPEIVVQNAAPTRRPRRTRRPRQISVILDEDIAAVFTSDKAVNDALRDLLRMGRKVAKRMDRRK